MTDERYAALREQANSTVHELEVLIGKLAALTATARMIAVGLKDQLLACQVCGKTGEGVECGEDFDREDRAAERRADV